MQESNKSLSGRLHDLASDQKLSKAVLDNHTLLLSECLDSKAIVQNISLVMEGTLHLQESGKHVL